MIKSSNTWKVEGMLSGKCWNTNCTILLENLQKISWGFQFCVMGRCIPGHLTFSSHWLCFCQMSVNEVPKGSFNGPRGLDKMYSYPPFCSSSFSSHQVIYFQSWWVKGMSCFRYYILRLGEYGNFSSAIDRYYVAPACSYPLLMCLIIIGRVSYTDRVKCYDQLLLLWSLT